LQASSQLKRANNYFIVRAFYQLKMPGTIMVDEDGKPVKPAPSWLHYMILELPSKSKLVIDSLIYNNMACNADTSALNNNDWIITKLKNPGRKAPWLFKTSSRKWLIQSGCTHAPAAGKTLIILKCRINGKTVIKKIMREDEEVLAEAM
jgi:hypothetical protein